MIKQSIEFTMVVNKGPLTPNDGFTTLEQSKRVEAAGIDPDTADFMYIAPYKTKRPNFIENPEHNISYTRKILEVMDLDDTHTVIPCWSLGRLLKVLPQAVKFEDQVSECPMPLVMYPNNKVRYENGYDDLSFRSEDGLVECVVRAIESLFDKQQKQATE